MKVVALKPVTINGIRLATGAVAECDANSAANLARKGMIGPARDELAEPPKQSKPKKNE